MTVSPQHAVIPDNAEPITRDAGVFGSIRNTVAGRPANSVWQIRDVFTSPFCTIAGKPRSLDEIEHEIIRPTFNDPRIHFAVNCAALNCPPLASRAYTGDDLEAQLDHAVRNLLEDSEHFRIEPTSPPTLYLNKVLDWYGIDFGGEDGLRVFLSGYLDGEAREVVLAPETGIRYFEYDWTLNDISR